MSLSSRDPGITLAIVMGNTHALMFVSRLTKKYQATVPEPVRRFLQLKAGDRIAFEIEENTITVRKASDADLEFARSLETMLSEWSSPFDEEAYRDL